MQDPNQLFIAYCADNQDVVDKIQQSLSASKFHFQEVNDRESGPEATISNQLLNQKIKGLLLISDNFLKSEPCMKGILSFIENENYSKKTQIVIIDGKYPAEDGQGHQLVETRYERVSNVIQYMNFWQEKYLEMRKIKRTLPPEEEAAFNEKIKIVKSISSEIGDFLRILRTKEVWSYELMEANNFKFFFDKFGNTESYKTFQKIQVHAETMKEEPVDSFELEQDLSQLPGIDLLTKAESEGIPPIVEEKLDKAKLVTEPILVDDQPPADGNVKTTEGQMISSKKELGSNDFETFSDDEPRELSPEMNESYQELQALYDDEEEDILEDITEDFELHLTEKEQGKLTDINPPDEPSEDSVSNVEVPEYSIDEASALIKAGESGQAVQLLQQMIEEDPYNNEARFLLAGTMMAFRKNSEEAKQHLVKITELDPENEEAFLYLAKIAESSHDYVTAKKYYEKVVKLAPDQKGIYYKLGLITSGFFKEEAELSAKYFKKAIKENKKNTDAWYRLGVLYNEEFDKPEKALKHFKKVLKLQSGHPFANYDLALLYHTIGDPRNAASYYQKACKINPEVHTEDNDEVFMLDKYSRPGGSFGKDKKKSKSKRKKSVKIPKFVRKLSKSVTSERIAAITEEEVPVRQNKTVFITGATSGIGKATAEKFAENGYRLILNGRRSERLEEMQQSLVDRYNAKLIVLPFDVRDIDSVKQAIDQLDDEWSQVDILINNAGLAKGYAPIHEGELEHWETMIDTNVKGLLYLTRAVAPHMVKRRSGHIINVCSSAGHEVYPNGNVYCATKYAVDALTKSTRLDLHQYNIRVGQVSPGHVEETEFAYVRFEDHNRAKIYEDFQPLKSSDVAEAIYFMATTPPHVNIQDIQMFGTQQASNNHIDRSGR